MRQIFNCKACKHTEANDYTVLRTEMYGPGRMYERRVYGRINAFGREVQPRTDLIECPGCKKFMRMEMVKGVVTEHVCDERCTEAKGHKCECSCGGKNHGKAHLQGVAA